jgi:DNA-binding response OmpR family regulator
MKIVVADDDPVARLLIEAILLSRGHQVIACADGKSAWEAISDCGASIVVSDWMMPGMDGLELCRRLRSENHKVYFILVSSTVNSPVRERQAVEAGVDDVILKPAMPDVFSEHMRVAEQLCVA